MAEELSMTGGSFEPYRVAETGWQGGSDAWTWEPSGSWEHAETWDYDEGRATAEAQDLQGSPLPDRQESPRFGRFRAAVADAAPAMPGPRRPSRVRPPADLTWLDAAKTLRFWSSVVWLVSAAGAGVLAGIVSTDIVALALNPAAPSVLATQLATASSASRPAGPAAAPASVTTAAQAAARPAPSPEQAVPSNTTVATVARQLEPLAAEDQPPSAASQPAALQPAPLPPAVAVEPAPDLPAAATQPPAAAAAPAMVADQAERGPTPAPPQAASAARVAAPVAPASANAPSAEYRVQLAMLRDKQNVKYVWHDFVAQLGSAASELKRYVLPTQTAHGTRHLVQVGPFADQDHAEAMCSKLKQRGGDCLVVHRPS